MENIGKINSQVKLKFPPSPQAPPGRWGTI